MNEGHWRLVKSKRELVQNPDGKIRKSQEDEGLREGCGHKR